MTTDICPVNLAPLTSRANKMIPSRRWGGGGEGMSVTPGRVSQRDSPLASTFLWKSWLCLLCLQSGFLFPRGMRFLKAYKWDSKGFLDIKCHTLKKKKECINSFSAHEWKPCSVHLPRVYAPKHSGKRQRWRVRWVSLDLRFCLSKVQRDGGFLLQLRAYLTSKIALS